MSPLRILILVASGLLLAAPAALSADPPPTPSTASPASGAARRPLEGSRERILERLRERGLALPSGSGAAPMPSFSAPLGSAGPAASNAAAITEELGRKWRALTATRLERRERHRAALVRELGQRLSSPHVKAELKLHATRIAELSRIQFLAENARRGAEREKLLTRVKRLRDRENERHQKRIAVLASASAAAGASASGSAPSPRPSSEAPR
jgi:hypothetical protein